MKHHIPRQFGKTISQKAYIISNKLAQHNPITLLEAWDFVLEKVEYKVLVNILLNSGAQAFKLEQWCKDTFKEYRYVGESPFKLTGITEIFNIDISAQPEFILHLNKIKDSNE